MAAIIHTTWTKRPFVWWSECSTTWSIVLDPEQKSFEHDVIIDISSENHNGAISKLETSWVQDQLGSYPRSWLSISSLTWDHRHGSMPKTLCRRPQSVTDGASHRLHKRRKLYDIEVDHVGRPVHNDLYLEHSPTFTHKQTNQTGVHMHTSFRRGVQLTEEHRSPAKCQECIAQFECQSYTLRSDQ